MKIKRVCVWPSNIENMADTNNLLFAAAAVYTHRNNYGILAVGNGIYTAQDMIKRLRREQQITYSISFTSFETLFSSAGSCKNLVRLEPSVYGRLPASSHQPKQLTGTNLSTSFSLVRPSET